MRKANPKNRAVLYAAAISVSLYLMISIAVTQSDRLVDGRNDFIPLYTGPHLLAAGELYDNARLLEREQELTGWVTVRHGYIRPPFLAALMWPLSRLPYRTALRVWQAASLAALAGFVWLWDPDRRGLTALVTAMSLPVLMTWLKGQDVPFLMLAIAISARLHHSGRRVAAGAVFALCAAKPHLFLLTPFFVFGRREWVFLKGLLYGGGALWALSTAVAGWNWPFEMWEQAVNPMFSPSVSGMPNIQGAFAGRPLAWLWSLVASVATAWAVWTIARRSSFLPAFSAAILGGVLLARHSYLLDLALLIPAALSALGSANSAWIRLAAVALTAPPLMILALTGRPYSIVATALGLLLLMGWALERRSLGIEQEAQV
jgi:hypothetical protein